MPVTLQIRSVRLRQGLSDRNVTETCIVTITFFSLRRELLYRGLWQNIDYIICDTKIVFVYVLSSY